MADQKHPARVAVTIEHLNKLERLWTEQYRHMQGSRARYARMASLSAPEVVLKTSRDKAHQIVDSLDLRLIDLDANLLLLKAYIAFGDTSFESYRPQLIDAGVLPGQRKAVAS